jgi:hypothetical protein
MSTVQPYPAGTIWNYHNLRDPSVTRAEEILLSWEPNGCWITDDYLPEEIAAARLWKLWTDKVATLLSDDDSHYAPGDVAINWTVRPAAEYLPYAGPGGVDPSRETFLTFFSHPVHAVTGEKLNWARLPVLNKGWNADRQDKGGFIQEVLGWKPAPFQSLMNVHQLAAAAGLSA